MITPDNTKCCSESLPLATRHLRGGDTVLVLGSGDGASCFSAAEIVGADGRVIGIESNEASLEAARGRVLPAAERLGFMNMEFHKGRLQDLGLDLEVLDAELRVRPISDAAGFLRMNEIADHLRSRKPMVESDSVDLAIADRFAELIEPNAKEQLLQEVYRVLKDGGRVVISDIVSDEDLPDELLTDPQFCEGQLCGAFTEQGLMLALEETGFHGIEILERQVTPSEIVEGIEFRTMTIQAFKGKEGENLERLQAVIYRGPFKEVLDDDGHLIQRGQRYAVSDKTYQLFRQDPYRQYFVFVEPSVEIPLEEAELFDENRNVPRNPKETKGHEHAAHDDSHTCGEGCGCG